MPVETVLRRWTIATWRLAEVGDDLTTVARTLGDVAADAYALQTVREDDAARLAERLGGVGAWELSHHPVSRLIPGSGVGLAVLTRRRLGDSVSFVTNNHSSTWSRQRRIAQFAVVQRDDGSGYTIGHSVDAPDPEARGLPPAPLIWFRPGVVGVDDARAVDLPAEAQMVELDVRQPIAHAAAMMTVTFEMPWVTGGLAPG